MLPAAPSRDIAAPLVQAARTAILHNVKNSKKPENINEDLSTMLLRPEEEQHLFSSFSR
jgi:hypothetical protein